MVLAEMNLEGTQAHAGGRHRPGGRPAVRYKARQNLQDAEASTIPDGPAARAAKDELEAPHPVWATWAPSSCAYAFLSQIRLRHTDIEKRFLLQAG